MKKPERDEIIVAKRDRLARRKTETPLDAMRALASMQRRPQPILSTVTDDGRVMLVGQIRYGTPSYDPVTLALRYVQAGLDGIALFTDNRLYDGGINDLALVTRAVSVPVLLQNYIFDEYQVVEARAAGASSLTLIAGLVDASTLRELISATQRNRMSAVVRVQSHEELRATLDVCPAVIELGKRDPDSGILDVAHIESLRAAIPSTTRVLLYNRLRSFGEASAVARLKPDGVMVSPRLLEQDDAVARLHDIFEA
jgi:indole-3-glycerol phosphate synthase